MYLCTAYLGTVRTARRLGSPGPARVSRVSRVSGMLPSMSVCPSPTQAKLVASCCCWTAGLDCLALCRCVAVCAATPLPPVVVLAPLHVLACLMLNNSKQQTSAGERLHLSTGLCACSAPVPNMTD
ncbi:hypothetical protein LX32DRAFT_3124 [Colletotrichum zoysiae]|uniref:Uncharacterized protein n=1 Tax=Colletotrichum zoysiae TaxID=1216348 RepID=A0AAD9HV27_9PEZI|nr:hypothetical protein LX32DRAFT_3124 [Colletotrichum zoysiae]